MFNFLKKKKYVPRWIPKYCCLSEVRFKLREGAIEQVGIIIGIACDGVYIIATEERKKIGKDYWISEHLIISKKEV